MPNTSTDLDQFLDSLTRSSKAGERMPTIRALMNQFGVSQVIVQRAFQRLKDEGAIESEVGRGTFFRGDADAAQAVATDVRHAPAAPAKVKSVLLLRRSISIARGRVLLEGLQRRFAADGHRVLEVSYTDPAHAQTVLKGLPHFDACVVQSSFRNITIELLASLRSKCSVIAVDGAALVGADVDAVGMEWGEPLAESIALLERQGHRSIAFASTTQPLLATQLGLRRFEHLQKHATQPKLGHIGLPQCPDEGYQAALVDALKAMADKTGRLPFSALVAWGIEDGAGFRDMLAAAGFDVPSSLSVVLLGRTDLPNEHADFFDTVGCRVADQIDELFKVIQLRWTEPASPFGVHLIPVSARAGKSIATVRSSR